jgi:GNAT superfamily N-acetyltransferase
MPEQSKRSAAQLLCTVRPPEPGDYEKMADLAEQLHYPSSGNQIRMRLDAVTNSKQHGVYVAELPGGQIGGWIGLYVFHSVEQDSCAGISGLIVDEQIRSRGIGKLLVDAGDSWARSKGCKAISVHSNVIRERAHQFYARNGFEHVKTQKFLFKAF